MQNEFRAMRADDPRHFWSVDQAFVTTRRAGNRGVMHQDDTEEPLFMCFPQYLDQALALRLADASGRHPGAGRDRAGQANQSDFAAAA